MRTRRRNGLLGGLALLAITTLECGSGAKVNQNDCRFSYCSGGTCGDECLQLAIGSLEGQRCDCEGRVCLTGQGCGVNLPIRCVGRVWRSGPSLCGATGASGSNGGAGASDGDAASD